jgi:amino acid permease
MPSAPQTDQIQAHRIQTNEDGLRHQLSAGQMAMVAVGGSIGTGLLLAPAPPWKSPAPPPFSVS